MADKLQDRLQTNLSPATTSSNRGARPPLWRDSRLWLILALALGLGLAVCLPHRGDTVPKIWPDALDYHDMAKGLLATGHFEGTYRAPGYPTFVAFVYFLFGIHPFAAYCVQCVLFAISLWLVANIIERITGNRAAALLAAALSAGFPYFYRDMLRGLLTESLAMFLLLLLLFLMMNAIASPAGWKGWVLGAVFSAAALTKAVLLPFALPVAVCLAFLTASHRDWLRQGLPFLVAVGICLAPWTYRNWKVTGALLPVSSGRGVAFWMGNYPGAYDARSHASDRAQEFPHLPPDLAAATRGMGELEQDRYLQQVGLSYIRSNPFRATGIFLHKFSALWLGSLGIDVGALPEGVKPEVTLGRFTVLKRSFLNVPIFILGLAGICMLRGGELLRSLPGLLLLAWFTFAYVLIYAELRYALPVYPCLFGFAAIGLVRLAERCHQHILGEKPG
jgi:4-amino-4-deoxy-L-arabinose transferase-like glycosyltransferase